MSTLREDLKAGLRAEFWASPDDALLDRKTTSAALGFSMGWMEKKATDGGGPPFYKMGRHVLYKKSDVIKWIEKNSQFVESTKEYIDSVSINYNFKQ